MVNVRPAGVPLGLLLATVLLALVLVHTIAYAVSLAIGDVYASAMTSSHHHAYWPPFVAVAIGLTAIAAISARSRTGFARKPGGASPPGRARLVFRVWVTLAIASLVGFVLLENLEAVVNDHAPVGLAPLALLGRLAALGPLAIGITALALAAVAIVLVGRVEYSSVLNRSYADLVMGGVYTADFRQSPWAVDFLTRVVREVLAEGDAAAPLRILECGCGTGVWLEELATITSTHAGPVSLAGFDLSPDMAAAARSRLERAGVAAEAREGDILDPAAYRFGGADRHDLVIAYDVVQQLPADIQQAAIDSMLEHVAPGGHLVVFDHDADTRYGRIMGTKKWLRRYLGIPLVPRFYIHASYPRLDAIRRRAAASGLDARIVVEVEARKRALVIAIGQGASAAFGNDHTPPT